MKSFDMRGNVEFLGDGGISGWVIDNPECSNVIVELYSNGTFVSCTSGGDIRDDIADILSEDEDKDSVIRGWRIVLPSPLYQIGDQKLSIIFRQDLKSQVIWESEMLALEGGYDFYIDTVELRRITGWARDRADEIKRLTVALHDGSQIISIGTANRYTPAVKAAGYSDGRFGFSLPIPIAMRFKGNIALSAGIITSGKFVKNEDVHILRGDVKALFIISSKGDDSASIYYRSEVVSQQLWRCGVETVVMADNAIMAQSFSDFDFVFLHGCAVTETIKAGLKIARHHDALIIANVGNDDFDTSIRCGQTDSPLRDAGRSISDCEKILDLSDVVLTSSRSAIASYNEAGFDTVYSPTVFNDSFILKQPRINGALFFHVVVYADYIEGQQYFDIVRSSILNFSQNHPYVRVTIIGKVGHINNDVYPNIFVFENPMHHERIGIISSADVVLIHYNKSSKFSIDPEIKFIEAASQGVPVIASHCDVIIEMIDAAGVGSILAEDGDWYNALVECHGNRSSRSHDAAKLIKFVKENFAISAGNTDLVDELIGWHDRIICQRGQVAGCVD